MKDIAILLLPNLLKHANPGLPLAPCNQSLQTEQRWRMTKSRLAHPSPNKSLRRSVNHKVLGRWRVDSALWRAPSARVLTGQPAAAELSR